MDQTYAIIAQVRNKSIRLQDWILYHYEEGFNIFIIFDDHSTDDTKDELERITNEYGIRIFLSATAGPFNVFGKNDNVLYPTGRKDGELLVKDGEYLKSTHATCPELARRICNSFTRGNDLLKKLFPGAICTCIDDDEFLVTEIEGKRVVDVIEDIFEQRKIEYKGKEAPGRYSEQILLSSVDVKDQYELGRWYTANDNTNQLWSEEELNKDLMWRNRTKCVIKSESMETCTFMHVLLDGAVKTFWDEHNNVVSAGDVVRDYSLLKIVHFRKPEQLNANIKFTTNNTLLNKCKRMKQKYEEQNG